MIFFFAQAPIAVLLVGNFVANAFEAQIRQDLMDEDGNPTPIKIVLEKVDVGFTTVFTAELMINMYAHLWWDFVSNGWCIFDFLVIAVSLITIFGEGLPAMPITIFRLVRTFRVLRLFGRLESIRSIINALSASLLPVMNAFFIMFIVLALYAILGVTLFSDMAPHAFGNLSLAIIELFRIAAGETWISEVPEADEEGNVNWGVGLYVMSFILICNWTLLQVSVAVLLDNFVNETARAKDEKHVLFMEHKRSKDSIGNVLDPLLRMLSMEYIDERDLSLQLSLLYQLLCSMTGETHARLLTKEQFCDAMSRLKLEAPMHLSKLDYDTLTDLPQITVHDFIFIMRSQVPLLALNPTPRIDKPEPLTPNLNSTPCSDLRLSLHHAEPGALLHSAQAAAQRV